MNIVAELNARWNEAARTAPSGHEWRGVALSVYAPVRLLAAVREPDGHITLLIEAPMSAAPSVRLRFETQGLSLTEHRRPAENVFRIAVTLERQELKDVFEALCADLVAVVSPVVTAVAAFAAMTKRLEAWQACLRVRKGGLSREERIGLLGELVMLRLFAEVAGYNTAVEAWKGPIDGIHDFMAGGAAVEVKSVLGIGSHLHISRFDQLEMTGLSSLTISRVRFREGQDGISLPGHIEGIRREIANASPAAVPDFDNKLLRAGYLDLDGQLYSSACFVQEVLYCYAVDEKFPRIAREDIPPAVVDGSYILDERALSSFRQGRDYLCQVVRMNVGAAHD
ncbi:PD-(D/E)XK motif protein [Bradyrhizobium diazoefficiens]|uniref:PD-(D/E)XK motif protein n=1 Tax=Bradyrhizobium diazoefficiens TaxID=1355477 RepID=UPI001909593F|nr:PD-(D/E)XK motif protein [Bradyrhizobium diazoefficiens]MBK3664787.1 PD-(D/E)XK motif protein [Bradyrhizobium diazoefficiens]